VHLSSPNGNIAYKSAFPTLSRIAEEGFFISRVLITYNCTLYVEVSSNFCSRHFLKGEDKMPRIPNFPENLRKIHEGWHFGRTREIKPPNPGAGREFLRFHHDFILAVTVWCFQNYLDPQTLLMPWMSIPDDLKAPKFG
jgi:hypothetical protein